MAGNIDGIHLRGECACLIGSIANFQIKAIDDLCQYRYSYGLHNPAEQWFWQIRKEDTPQNSFFSKKAVEWCDELLNQKT